MKKDFNNYELDRIAEAIRSQGDYPKSSMTQSDYAVFSVIAIIFMYAASFYSQAGGVAGNSSQLPEYNYIPIVNGVISIAMAFASVSRMKDLGYRKHFLANGIVYFILWSIMLIPIPIVTFFSVIYLAISENSKDRNYKIKQEIRKGKIDEEVLKDAIDRALSSDSVQMSQGDDRYIKS